LLLVAGSRGLLGECIEQGPQIAGAQADRIAIGQIPAKHQQPAREPRLLPAQHFHDGKIARDAVGQVKGRRLGRRMVRVAKGKKRDTSKQAKKKAAAPPPPTPKAQPRPPRLGTVTLWGEILEENESAVKMAIKNHGDALDVGVNGTHWITKRQIFGRIGHADGYDFVRVNFAYASMLAQSCQQCE
jgi:hypothetical protein